MFAIAFWFPYLNFAGFFSLLLYNLIRKCSPNIFGESAFWSRVKLRFPLGSQHIIGYMLLQHVAVADHSLCTGRATCCATRFSENCFVCTGVLRNRILLPQRFAQIQIHLILRYL